MKKSNHPAGQEQEENGTPKTKLIEKLKKLLRQKEEINEAVENLKKGEGRTEE